MKSVAKKTNEAGGILMNKGPRPFDFAQGRESLGVTRDHEPVE
jgi:hypothetical protein